MNDSSENDDSLLHKAQQEIFKRLLPGIASIAFLCVVGIIGNILAIVFYTTKCKQTTTLALITVLATVDLIVCVLLVPKLAEMIINVEYTQRIICKVTQLLSSWAITSSCFILWMISIDRHRKICKPFAKQITVKSVKYIVIGILICTLVLAIRNAISYDIVSVNRPIFSSNITITGTICTVTDNPDYELVVFGFYAIDFLLILMIWTTVIVTYSHAIYTVLRRRQKQKRKSKHVSRNKSNETGTAHSLYRKSVYPQTDDGKSSFGSSDWSSCNDLREDYPESSIGNDVEQAESSPNETKRPTFIFELNEGVNSNGNLQRQTDAQRETKKRHRVTFAATKNPLDRNLTIMMCSASMFFILCLAPYYAVRVYMRLVLGAGTDYELSVGIQLALKLPFLHSVVNPIIYCIFNPKYRKYIKHTLLRCR